MMKHDCRRSVLAVAMFAISTAAAAESIGPAAMLANACGGCHGTLGASAGPSIPSLAGQSRTAFVDAMNKFRSGERPSTVMGRLAKAYDDEQIAMLADFFSHQPLHFTQQTLDAGKIAQGARLRETNCAGCHLDNGEGGKNDTPIIASQWLPYLQLQMAMYRNGQRKMPEDMADKVKDLSSEDLDALLNFYASMNK